MGIEERVEKESGENRDRVGRGSEGGPEVSRRRVEKESGENRRGSVEGRQRVEEESGRVGRGSEGGPEGGPEVSRRRVEVAYRLRDISVRTLAAELHPFVHAPAYLQKP